MNDDTFKSKDIKQSFDLVDKHLAENSPYELFDELILIFEDMLMQSPTRKMYIEKKLLDVYEKMSKNDKIKKIKHDHNNKVERDARFSRVQYVIKKFTKSIQIIIK